MIDKSASKNEKPSEGDAHHVDPRGGWNRKPIEQHILDGTVNVTRHKDRLPKNKLNIPKKPASIIKASARSQQKWCRNSADERAVAAGYRFNEALAAHVVDFFADYLCHSKGQYADQPFILTDWQQRELIYPLFGWVRPDGTRRFRRSYIEIPKKNYKSTTAAGVGLYMLVADEEAGAEVYSLGADKDQAQIVHREAISMVDASERLKDNLKINRTTGQIAYADTRSFYKALSATPRGKHGINIHCGIGDELHEWYGDKLWNAIKYGYRARRQPLQFVITNAGDDMESVCRQQHDKARGILDGTLFDNSFFAMICDVPESEADAEIKAVGLGATELPIAEKCNPALGHVIKTEDLLQDVRDAIQTPRELPNLKRLTYGVWATSERSWLEPDLWAAAVETYTEADMSGLPCFAGLDLGKTRDMSSLVLVFREGTEKDGTYRLMPWFWVPEDWARAKGHLASYQQWSDAGHLVMTSGGECDYSFIETEVIRLAERFDIQAIWYDGWHASDLTQRINDQTGLERVEFQQSMKNYAGPSAAFERALIGGRLKHNGHPVLSWQAGHVAVYEDNNGNIRPIKQKRDDYRAVDGIVASVMGFAGAMTLTTDSIYNSKELIIL